MSYSQIGARFSDPSARNGARNGVKQEFNELSLISADEIAAARSALAGRVLPTPTVDLGGSDLVAGSEAACVVAKFEHWQRTGTFKIRGAILSIDALSDDAREAGVTAVSAGNHAIATAAAAALYGISARVVMTRSANPYRVEQCRSYGAEIEFADTVHQAFELAESIQQNEGRAFIHPFDSRQMLLGSATLGAEMVEQCAAADTVIVPVGGGGLIGGVAAAVHALAPACRVIGVEPTGADSMQRSLAAGRPVTLDSVATIADSLGAPFAMEQSFAYSQAFVERVVTVSDGELRTAMRRIYDTLGFIVEPACAATTAALLGPLASEVSGQRVVLVYCGSNIDVGSAHAILSNDDAR